MMILILILLFSKFVANAANAHAALAADSSCVPIALIGQFTRSTTRTIQPFGQEIQLGTQAFLNQNSRDSKIRKERLKICRHLHLIDIKSSLAQIPELIEKAVKEQNIHLFIGLGNSDQALVGMRAIQNLPAMIFTPTASSEQLNISNGKVVMLFPDNRRIAVRIEQEATRRGIKSVAVIYGENSEYSKDMARVFISRFKKSGGKIPVEIPLRLGQISRSDLEVLKRVSVSHVFLPLYELDAAKVISYLNHHHLEMKFIGTDAWGTYSHVMRRFTGSATIQAFYPSLYSIHMSNQTNRKFIKEYQKILAKNPTDLSAFSYDAVRMIDRLLRVCSVSQLTSQPSFCIDKVLPFDSTTGVVKKFNKASLEREIEIREY